MKINIKLIDTDGKPVYSGKVRVEDVDRKHLIRRGDTLYGFRTTEGLTTFVFQECGEPYEIKEE